MLVIIVSACLAGLCTRFDGASRPAKEIILMVESGEALALCPEQLGGLSIPRPPAEITGPGDGYDVLDGRAAVIDKDGKDVTAAFVRGAEEMLRAARAAGAQGAILKDRSPSCGVTHIYRQGVLVTGRGVAAALLARNGLTIRSESELDTFKR